MRIDNNKNGTYCITLCADELRIINASLYGVIKSAYQEPSLDANQEHFASVCMKMYEDCEQVILDIKKRMPRETIVRCFTCAKVLKKGHPKPEDIESGLGMCSELRCLKEGI